MKVYEKQLRILKIIEDNIEMFFDLESGGVKTKSRKRDKVVVPRQFYFRLAKEYSGMSLLSLASSVGLENHATVINALKRFESYYKTDRYYREEFDEIHKIIQLELIKENLDLEQILHNEFVKTVNKKIKDLQGILENREKLIK